MTGSALLPVCQADLLLRHLVEPGGVQDEFRLEQRHRVCRHEPHGPEGGADPHIPAGGGSHLLHGPHLPALALRGGGLGEAQPGRVASRGRLPGRLDDDLLQTSLQPVRDAVHRNRFGRSLLAPPWRDALDSLVSRGLARLDDAGVTLTPDGEVLVEAVINTELDVAD